MTHLGQAQKGHKKNAAKTERRFRTCVLRSLQRALFAYYDLRGEGQRLRCRWLVFLLPPPPTPSWFVELVKQHFGLCPLHEVKVS